MKVVMFVNLHSNDWQL